MSGDHDIIGEIIGELIAVSESRIQSVIIQDSTVIGLLDNDLKRSEHQRLFPRSLSSY